VPRLISVGEATAVRRQVYFHLVGTDFTTPALSEAGGQPQISTDGAAWTNTGIGVLVSIGNGRYHATLTTGAVAAVASIETRYKSASTAECPGDSVEVITPIDDPDGYCRATGSTTTNFVLAANAPSQDMKDVSLVMTRGPLAGYAGIIKAYNTATKEATMSPEAEVPPTALDGYIFNGYAAGRLTSDGADAVMVEAGVNMRQAMSPILAASAGALSGAGSGTIAIKGGNSAVTRVTATTDNAGNRTAVTLNLPA
jgi:hypothetical protein